MTPEPEAVSTFRCEQRWQGREIRPSLEGQELCQRDEAPPHRGLMGPTGFYCPKKIALEREVSRDGVEPRARSAPSPHAQQIALKVIAPLSSLHAPTERTKRDETRSCHRWNRKDSGNIVKRKLGAQKSPAQGE